MCQLSEEKVTNGPVYGFKVVARDNKTGKLYSPATGVEYIPDMLMEVVLPLNCGRVGSNHFSENVCENAWERLLVGRTAIFLTLPGARELVRNLLSAQPKELIGIYDFLIIPCSVERDVLEGWYGIHRVVAGRVLHFSLPPKEEKFDG